MGVSCHEAVEMGDGSLRAAGQKGGPTFCSCRLPIKVVRTKGPCRRRSGDSQTLGLLHIGLVPKLSPAQALNAGR